MLNTCKKTITSLLFLFTFLLANAQLDVSVYNKIKDKYQGEKMVQLSEIAIVNISIKKDKLVVNRKIKEKYIYINKVSLFDYKRSIFSSDFTKLVDYEANSYIYNDDKYKKTAIKQYNEVSSLGGSVFYDDSKEYSFTFPGLTNGSVIEMNTEHSIADARMINSVIFGNFIPIDNFQLEFNVDNRVNIDFITKNFENSNIDYTVTKGKKYTKYIWTANNIKRIKDEARQPAIRYFVPHVIPIVRSYETKKGRHEVLSSLSDLYKWYYSFIKDLDTDISKSELQKTADEITKDCKTDLEKVEKIYGWVQKNINYVAFEYGMGGLIPRKPDEVLRKRYGDCKDYSSILYELLKLSGITSHLTWIGTRDLPYKFTEICSPISDNHMILTYIDDNKYYFLDGTGEFHYLGLPTYSIQGKEALISIDSANYKVVTVPVISSDKNIRYDKVDVSIEGKNIKGSGTYHLSGYPKILFQYRFDGLKNKKLDDAMEDRLELGNNRFELIDYDASSLKSYLPEMVIPFSYEINNYVRAIDDELYINLNLDKEFLWNKLKDDRETPLQFRFRNRVQHEYKLKIPEGYQIDFIPDDVSLNNDVVKMSITYTVRDDTIIYNHIIEGKLLVLYPGNFSQWNELMKDVESAYKKAIVLKKIN